MSHEDESLAALAAGLPTADVDAVTAQRIRSRALEALAAPPRRRLGAIGPAVEVALIAGIAASYLFWAFSTVLTMHR